MCLSFALFFCGLLLVNFPHHSDVIMSTMASQITSLTVVYSTVYSGADQSKHQSYASLAFVRGIYRWPVNSPHKGKVTRKMFPFHDVIMLHDYFIGTWEIKPWKSKCGCIIWMDNSCIYNHKKTEHNETMRIFWGICYIHFLILSCKCWLTGTWLHSQCPQICIISEASGNFLLVKYYHNAECLMALSISLL